MHSNTFWANMSMSSPHIRGAAHVRSEGEEDPFGDGTDLDKEDSPRSDSVPHLA